MDIKIKKRLVAIDRRIWIWISWVFCFFLIWIFLLVSYGLVQEALDHWPIALAMAFGSYAAGSTPMGGGTVGFPILVLLFDLPTSLGRDFSLAVQSIGMVSASIYIYVRRIPIAKDVLIGAVLGGLIGLPLGFTYVTPLVNDIIIKVIFACVWSAFGLIHLHRLNEFSLYQGYNKLPGQAEYVWGFVTGCISSAIITSTSGVGIDMAVYSFLVIAMRTDLKIAIPTSVVIMALMSVYGISLRLLEGGIEEEVFYNWMAAAPIVIFGAPLGAVAIERLGRKPTLMVVAFLCVAQFVWTCIDQFHSLRWWGCFLAVVCVIGLTIGLEALCKLFDSKDAELEPNQVINV